jgi:hypothetical protein
MTTRYFLLQLTDGEKWIVKFTPNECYFHILKTLTDTTKGVRFNPNSGSEDIDIDGNFIIYPISNSHIQPGPRKGWKSINSSFYNNPSLYSNRIEF